LVFAAILTLVGARASGRSHHAVAAAPVGRLNTAWSAPLMAGGQAGRLGTAKPRAVTARKGSPRKPVTLTDPAVLHLKAAHANVF